MALDLTAEQKQLGMANANAAASDLSRRGFMKSLAAGAAVVPIAAAAYFGYENFGGKPVKAALIGCGDEGGVLMGEHDPKFVEIIALCDVRPYNQKRIIEGEGAASLRKGYKGIYGEENAKKVAAAHMYSDYEEMLQKEKDIEAVIIAVPLHLHAPIAIKCMEAGKHVLCEKLMARTIAQCKEMIKVAKKTNRILSIGHQRHYSMLYAHATEMIHSGILGDINHIRALWHRNFTWDWRDDGKFQIVQNAPDIRQATPEFRDGWFQPIQQQDYEALKDQNKLAKYDYKSVEELIRWRLFNRTGGGLMAELGSHQLDACSIFLGKVKPLSVMGVGTRSFFGDVKNPADRRNPRGIDDQVFTTFEFPGKNYADDKNDVVVVTYSSISTNGFEPYGECVMGSRGTMVVSSESELMLFKERNPTDKKDTGPKGMSVTVGQVGNKPAMEAAGTWGGPPPAAAGASAVTGTGGGPVSRGYKEEMADFAHCIRLWNDKVGYEKKPQEKGTTKVEYVQRLPRCHGEVAMADAILALTANLAMAKRERIVFKPEWFNSESNENPDTGVKFED
jgi:predicted dehydrogenase